MAAGRYKTITGKTETPSARTTALRPFFYTAFGALLLSFVLLAIVVGHNVLAIDLSLTRAIQSIQAPLYAWTLIHASDLGFFPLSQITYVAALAGLWLAGRPRSGVLVVVATALVSLCATIVKELVRRPRPSTSLVHVATRLHDASFPSGHVVHYVVMFGFVVYLVVSRRLYLAPGWRAGATVVLVALIVLVGPSRVYLGQHWPTDTLGGYLLGGAVLLVSIAIERRWNSGSPRSLPSMLARKRR